jgi:hypothetical protein
MNHVESVMENYWDVLSEKYSLDKDELRSLWQGSTAVKPSKPSKPSIAKPSIAKPNPPALETVDMEDISEPRLLKCNLNELKALCRSRNLKVGGKKSELIDRLLGKEEGTEKPVKASPAKEKSTKNKVETSDVIKKLTANIPVLPIRKNAFGNPEHPETGLVFDVKTESVVGRQLDDGTVATLTPEDIENCKRFKFRYIVPENLDQKDTLDNVEVEELESDSEIELESDSEIEVEDDEDSDDDEEVEEDDD